MRKILEILFVVACAALISSCCAADCVDVGDNYTLVEVAYDQDDSMLYVSGNVNLGYCGGSCDDDVDKYGATQLVLDLESLEYEVEADTYKSKKTIEAPEELPRLFIGSFGSYCNRCDLSLRTDDDKYLLLFTTDLEAAWERFEAHGIAVRSMLLSISSGEDILAEFTFGFLSVENLPE